jgi:leucyl aminopeptidase
MFSIESKPLNEIKSDALIINVFSDENGLPEDLKPLNELTDGLISELVEHQISLGSLFEVANFYRPRGLLVTRLSLIGSGARSGFNFEVACKVAGAAARNLQASGSRETAFLMRGELSAERRGQACVEGALLAVFEPGKYKTKRPKRPGIDSIALVSTKPDEEDELRKGGKRGLLYAAGTNYARNLVNEPSNFLTPKRLAEEAVALAEEYGMRADVLGPGRIKELGMNALLSVGKGSIEPPHLCVVEYRGDESRSPNIALVGKGLTFDAGGISLKVPEGMHYMKNDMAGAAAVLGAMKIIAELKPKINVLGIIAAAENMPSGGAQKPGDVVKAFNKKTIEVLDADAEGRLVLADAISYARHLGATHLVDLATLTQSVVIALGDFTTGVMANDDAWATEVMKAAAYAGEKMWQLPTFPEYGDLIESEIADITNIANRQVAHSNVRPAGAIVGAMFLKEFAEDTSWAHLDIGGTAWNSRILPYLGIGPTGVGVRTLASLILSKSGFAIC